MTWTDEESDSGEGAKPDYKRYMGDLVYADFDGFRIILTTEYGNGLARNTILLDDHVFEQLVVYGKKVFAGEAE